MLSILSEMLHEPSWRWMWDLCGTNSLYFRAMGPAAQVALYAKEHILLVSD